MADPQPEPTALPAGHSGDRRTVGLPGAVALGLVRSPPWWIVRVGVRNPFFPPRLVHLVGLGVLVRQGRAVGSGERAGLDRVPQSEQMLAADAHSRASFAVGTP